MAKITFTQLNATPAPPSTGQVSIYVEGDVLYLIDSTGLVTPLGVASGITHITGDVTADGPGTATATVNLVGGQTAANVASAVTKVLAATSTNTGNTLVIRDSSGNFSANIITANLSGTASGNTTTATAPLISTGGTTPSISIPKSSSSQDGYLSGSDWTIFNGKAPLDSNGYVPLANINPSLQTPAYQEYHVNPAYSGTSVGTYNQPFTTLQSAVNAAQSLGLANTVIFLHGSTSTENVVINNYGFNLAIEAFGSTAKDSQTFTLVGNITISGTSTRIRLKDFKIAYPGGTQPDLIDSSAGRNYFSNMDFGGGGGIQYTGSWARWHEYVDCTINGNVNIAGSPSTGSQISMWRTRGGATYTLNSSNVYLLLVDSENIGTITHTAGSLELNGGTGFTSSTAINSTANSPDVLKIVNTSLQISGTSSFSSINKTGTANYILSNVFRNESGDVLSGARLLYGATSADQSYLPTTTTDWSTTPSNVKQGLDTLANEVNTINTVTSIAYALIFG